MHASGVAGALMPVRLRRNGCLLCNESRVRIWRNGRKVVFFPILGKMGYLQ